MISDCWAKIGLMVCAYLILGACSSSSPPITHPPGIDTTPPEEVHLTVTLLNSQGGTNQQASTSNTTSSSPGDNACPQTLMTLSSLLRVEKIRRDSKIYKFGCH